MKIQLFLVGLFALNLIVGWFAHYINKSAWYRPVELTLFSLIPLLMVIPSQPKFELDYFWWLVAGWLAMAAGLVIIYLAAKALGSGDKLITTGTYAFLRHPLYLGAIFVFVGWWWVWAAVYAFYFGLLILVLIWVQGYLEEKWCLESRYGAEYLDYRTGTGMFWIK